MFGKIFYKYSNLKHHNSYPQIPFNIIIICTHVSVYMCHGLWFSDLPTSRVTETVCQGAPPPSTYMKTTTHIPQPRPPSVKAPPNLAPQGIKLNLPPPTPHMDIHGVMLPSDFSVPPPVMFNVPPPPPGLPQPQSYPSQSPDQHWGGLKVDHSIVTEQSTSKSLNVPTDKQVKKDRKAYHMRKARIHVLSQPLGKMDVVSKNSKMEEKAEKSNQIKSATEKLDLSKIEIRQCDNPVRETPRFVPRQLAKKTTGTIQTLKKSAPVSNPINEELRKSAAVLANRAAGKLPFLFILI